MRIEDLVEGGSMSVTGNRRGSSLDGVSPSLYGWLEEELEARGIDSSIYTRYVISLLQDESGDLEVVSTPEYRISQLRRWTSEDLRKSAAIECLLSVAEQESSIEDLVEELYRKLNTNDDAKPVDANSPSRGFTAAIRCPGRLGSAGESERANSAEEGSDSVISTSPEDPAERYFAAFPALHRSDSTEECQLVGEAVPKFRVRLSSGNDADVCASDPESFSEKVWLKIEEEHKPRSKSSDDVAASPAHRSKAPPFHFSLHKKVNERKDGFRGEKLAPWKKCDVEVPQIGSKSASKDSTIELKNSRKSLETIRDEEELDTSKDRDFRFYPKDGAVDVNPGGRMAKRFPMHSSEPVFTLPRVNVLKSRAPPPPQPAVETKQPKPKEASFCVPKFPKHMQRNAKIKHGINWTVLDKCYSQIQAKQQRLLSMKAAKMASEKAKSLSENHLYDTQNANVPLSGEGHCAPWIPGSSVPDSFIFPSPQGGFRKTGDSPVLKTLNAALERQQRSHRSVSKSPEVAASLVSKKPPAPLKLPSGRFSAERQNENHQDMNRLHEGNAEKRVEAQESSAVVREQLTGGLSILSSGIWAPKSTLEVASTLEPPGAHPANKEVAPLGPFSPELSAQVPLFSPAVPTASALGDGLLMNVENYELVDNMVTMPGKDEDDYCTADFLSSLLKEVDQVVMERDKPSGSPQKTTSDFDAAHGKVGVLRNEAILTTLLQKSEAELQQLENTQCPAMPTSVSFVLPRSSETERIDRACSWSTFPVAGKLGQCAGGARKQRADVFTVEPSCLSVASSSSTFSYHEGESLFVKVASSSSITETSSVGATSLLKPLQNLQIPSVADSKSKGTAGSTANENLLFSPKTHFAPIPLKANKKEPMTPDSDHNHEIDELLLLQVMNTPVRKADNKALGFSKPTVGTQVQTDVAVQAAESTCHKTSRPARCSSLPDLTSMHESLTTEHMPETRETKPVNCTEPAQYQKAQDHTYIAAPNHPHGDTVSFGLFIGKPTPQMSASRSDIDQILQEVGKGSVLPSESTISVNHDNQHVTACNLAAVPEGFCASVLEKSPHQGNMMDLWSSGSCTQSVWSTGDSDIPSCSMFQGPTSLHASASVPDGCGMHEDQTEQDVALCGDVFFPAGFELEVFGESGSKESQKKADGSKPKPRVAIEKPTKSPLDMLPEDLRQRARELLQLRKPCSFYLENGFCRKSDCRFIHDLTEVSCRFWLEGACFKGILCPFLHDYPSELTEQSPAGVPANQQLEEGKPTSQNTSRAVQGENCRFYWTSRSLHGRQPQQQGKEVSRHRFASQGSQDTSGNSAILTGEGRSFNTGFQNQFGNKGEHQKRLQAHQHSAAEQHGVASGESGFGTGGANLEKKRSGFFDSFESGRQNKFFENKKSPDNEESSVNQRPPGSYPNRQHRARGLVAHSHQGKHPYAREQLHQRAHLKQHQQRVEHEPGKQQHGRFHQQQNQRREPFYRRDMANHRSGGLGNFKFNRSGHHQRNEDHLHPRQIGVHQHQHRQHVGKQHQHHNHHAGFHSNRQFHQREYQQQRCREEAQMVDGRSRTQELVDQEPQVYRGHVGTLKMAGGSVSSEAGAGKQRHCSWGSALSDHAILDDHNAFPSKQKNDVLSFWNNSTETANGGFQGEDVINVGQMNIDEALFGAQCNTAIHSRSLSECLDDPSAPLLGPSPASPPAQQRLAAFEFSMCLPTQQKEDSNTFPDGNANKEVLGFPMETRFPGWHAKVVPPPPGFGPLSSAPDSNV